MRRSGIFAAALLAIVAMLPTSALAQSGCSIFSFGNVPTAGQWNQCLQSKQDALGYTAVNKAGDVMTGRLATTPSTTFRAGFQVPAGVAPSAPVDGDIWTTTAGIFVRINGSTVGPLTGAGSTVPSVVQGDLLYGSAPGTLSALAKNTSSTRYLSNTGTSNNPAWAQVNLANGVTGALPLANLPTGTQDTLLGYFTSTTAAASAVPNCTSALTYSTSTHTFGCSAGAGTGTVTSVTLGTTGYGIAVTGTNPVTTSGTFTPAVSLSFAANTLGTNIALNNTANFFDGPSMAQGTTGTWFAAGQVTVTDTAGAANIDCKLWDGTNQIASGRASISQANFYVQIKLSGAIASPSGNIRISCKDNASTSGSIVFNATGLSTDSKITGFRML